MLIRSTQLEPEKFIDLISNEEIIIYEDVQGSKIWVNYVNGNWILRPKSINQNPINLIDMAMQKYYKYAWAYLLSLPDEVTDLLRPNMYFCFEYFPDNQPAHIKYERIPKNHLILTCICKYGKTYSYDVNELKTYAELFGVETLPMIYKGKLTDKQLKALTYFLYTNEKDTQIFFKDTNFAEFFYKLLNPFATQSYLKIDGFQQNLEKIVIRFVKSNKEYTLEILNPMYQKMQLKTDSEYSDVYSLLLFNFMQWLIGIDLDEIEIEGTTREIVYINLICKLFNMYIQKYERNIIDFIFVVPEFFNSDKFRINQALINNKTTLDYINKHSKIEYVFKIIMSNFQRQHKKEIGIINNIALEQLNNLSRKIQVKVEEQFNYNIKLNKYSYQLTNLNKYPNIKWEEDSKGYVYPEVDSLFPDNDGSDKKKKFKK
ncbi:MAG: hypothetical protein E6R13_07310 [Spirochaetes bacterium]|nr:MAG: hypothetical protein E6R13_07310 [Spirochaetota bacterium]